VRGIVLHKIKYKDTRDIVYLYTDAKGRKTYIFNHNNKSGHLYPLSLIEFESNERHKADMQYIKEFVLSPVLPEIFSNIRKSAPAMFIGEFLYRVLKEEGLNINLFEFISKSINLLDVMREGVANFHLHFLVQLPKYLGFAIPSNINGFDYFDIKACKFVIIKPLHPQFFDRGNTQILTELLDLPYDRLDDLKLSGLQRVDFLNNMLDFYSFRYDFNLVMKSLSVLHETFC
jgi:DNA repair protein RecO (recombination protein O)